MYLDQMINSKIGSTRIYWRTKFGIPLDHEFPIRWDRFDNGCDKSNFMNIQKLVSEESKKLVEHRCNGVWEKVIPSHYYEHYTKSLLRRRMYILNEKE